MATKKKRLGDDPFANKSLGGLDMLIGSTTDANQSGGDQRR